MSLISINKFFGDFNLAQKNDPAVAAKIQHYINIYEPQYLESVLGEDFAALFNAEVEDSRFEDLKNKLIADPSPIAAYVFCNIQESSYVMATGSGDAKPKTENATVAPTVYRNVRAWNIMAAQTEKLWKWLLKNKDIYPEFDITKVDGSFMKSTNVFGI